MAKKNDFMDGRNEGMLYAYNFAREHGIDAKVAFDKAKKAIYEKIGG